MKYINNEGREIAPLQYMHVSEVQPKYFEKWKIEGSA